ncbi:DNA-dependent metalloprotease SPRTN isoform 2-T2 [Clarias gariepinus]|uniref:DNA-dependent metalloprotease SPRTN isoform X2 n=1 Tax=Clarias gariepinus TaxID=13013 RepID=UPI00234D1560|nr:DNA-dependent metalloprotease SPRTN isoform X2 [Clarias gariepinus]
MGDAGPQSRCPSHVPAVQRHVLLGETQRGRGQMEPQDDTTLLHEMIHALLFVTQNNRDRDGHGPEFCKHMNRINQASGTKISIYHSFHDEVDVYRQHWWRCNGPCQNRKPFFGYVKRAMNRAPSARDPWWEEHRRTCGGTYSKIKEPENYGKKGKNEEKKGKNEEKKEKSASKKPGDKIKPAGSGSQDIRNVIPFSGKGIVLGGSTRPSTSIRSPAHSPEPLPEPARTPPADLRSPSITTTTTALPKRSIGNHKAFVNINGSPVRVTKTNGSLLRPKQSATVQDLFQNWSLKSPTKTNLPEPKQAPRTSSAKTSRDGKNSSSSTSSAGSPLSKYFGSPKSTANGIPGRIKQENGVPGFVSRHVESSAVGFSDSGAASRIKPKNGVSSSNIKHLTHFENKRHLGTSSTDFGSRVPSSSPTQFGSKKVPGTDFPGCGSSSSGSIKSEYSDLNSKSGDFDSKESLGSVASSSIPRLSGSPGKYGLFNQESTVVKSPNQPAASGGRKRGREDRNSAHIFDFFQRVSRSPVSPSNSSFSTERREERTGAEAPFAGASGAGGPHLSSTPLTVTCPVCQSKVPESQINQHLDSCLT